MFERIDLAPNSEWCLEAKQETWLLIVDGSGSHRNHPTLPKATSFSAQSDRVNIHVGAIGMVGLVAYTGGPRIGPAAALRTAGGNGLRGDYRRCMGQLPSPE